MWSHYAKSHTGFCIGFDKENLCPSSGNGLGPLIEKVIYTDEFFEHNTDEITKLTPEEGHARPQEIRRLLSTKHSDWKYEREHRLILELSPDQPDKYPDESWTGRFFEIGSEAVKEIYFGLNMNKDDKDMLKAIVSPRKIKCYEMKKTERSFGLSSTPLT